MQQIKISLDAEQIEFLNQFNQYGFRDKSTLIREAIQQFRHHLAQQHLQLSAKLYSELYYEEEELRTLTKADCLQTRSLDYRARLVAVRGRISPSLLRQIDHMLKIVFDLN